MFKTLVLKLTHRLWHREISRILWQAQRDSLISGKQLYELQAAFDPSREHRVYGVSVGLGLNGTDGVFVSRKVNQ